MMGRVHDRPTGSLGPLLSFLHIIPRAGAQDLGFCQEEVALAQATSVERNQKPREVLLFGCLLCLSSSNPPHLSITDPEAWTRTIPRRTDTRVSRRCGAFYSRSELLDEVWPVFQSEPLCPQACSLGTGLAGEILGHID